MKPDLPLQWISTVLRSRDQGVYHLVATTDHLVRSVAGVPAQSIPMVRAACGARPWAYSGTFPDEGYRASLGSCCQKCEAMAAKLRPPAEPTLCKCPQCGYLLSLFDRSQMVSPSTIRCPRCGRFRLEEFVTVPV
jgi:ribosomal protein S27E